jgi:hypothetical protein
MITFIAFLIIGSILDCLIQPPTKSFFDDDQND